MRTRHGATAIGVLLLNMLGDARAAPVAMTGTTGSYTQRFDTLVSSGSAPWTNDVNLAGWYADRSGSGTVTDYTAFDGDNNSGGFYSYGVEAATDRALGSLGSASAGHLWWGIALRAGASQTVTNLTVSFVGEQWRNSTASAQAITSAYFVATSVPVVSGSGYTTVPALTFTSPVTGGTTAIPLDGNQAANRTAVTASFAVNVPTNQYVMLRWYDPDHTGSDHGLAIDDVVVSWRAGTAPTLPSVLSVPPNGARENFDTIGTSATAPLPAAWRVDNPGTVRTVGSYAAATDRTSLLAGNSMSTEAGNGIYNFGAGLAASAGDRAVGGLSSSSASKSVNLYVKLRNDTGQPVGRWRVRYHVEKYRNGSNAAGFSVQLHTSTDGTTWTALARGATTFAVDKDNSGFANAPGVTVAEEKIVSLAVPPDGIFFLAWNYSVTSGTTTSNAQALGVDDAEISPWQPATVLILR
jgi:hypothetical protein